MRYLTMCIMPIRLPIRTKNRCVFLLIVKRRSKLGISLEAGKIGPKNPEKRMTMIQRSKQLLSPALLRCYQIAFPIHEEFGCCNMRTFGVFRPLWARFLRSTGTFTQGAQANLPGQREQGLSHRSETHAAKDSPFMLRNGDHHPCIGGGEFVRHIVERDVVLNDGFTMNASQSRQHYRHHIVGNKRETKTE